MNATKTQHGVRLIALILLAALIFSTLTSCGSTNTENEYTVTFKIGNEYLTSVTVKEGESVSLPQPPKRDNYFFRGYYSDSACTQPYSMAPVTASHTVWLCYDLDEAGLVNTITTSTLRSMVTVVTTSSTVPKWWEIWKQPEVKSGQGSGEIIEITGSGRCYVLTNCHVAVKEEGFDTVSYTVTDFHGTTYTAYQHVEPITGVASIDAAYDLALLYFDIPNYSADSCLVKKLPLAEVNPK